MERRCSLCGKTIKELAVEELQGTYNGKAINISLSSELCYPYEICNGCEDFLRLLVPKILEVEGIIHFDEKADKYKITK